MEVTEAKELALRLLVRSEVEAMLDDDTLGAFIRAVVAGALQQIGVDPIIAQAATDKRNAH